MSSKGNFLIQKWESLDDPKKDLARKAWRMITFKWRWQVALNSPFLVIWLLDKNLASVHAFNVNLLSSLPIPEWLVSFIHLS